MTMHTRTLGRTGETVTTLGYGAMELRGPDCMGGPATTDDEAATLLNAVLDAGITLIDTSPDYGASEEQIGRHLHRRRDEFFLATKCGCTPGGPAAPHDWAEANVRGVFEQSLRNLRTDHVDLLQVHLSPSPSRMAQDDTIATMQALQAAGQVRYLGMSGTLPELPGHIRMGVFDEFQIPYSALQPEHDDVITQAHHAGAGIIVRGGTARGTASAEKDFSVQPLSATGASAHDRWHAAGLDDLVDGMSRHEFMLRFTLTHPGVTAAIVGTANLAHLRGNVGSAATGPLPQAVFAEARRRLGLPEL